jgi:hypothetical protein
MRAGRFIDVGKCKFPTLELFAIVTGRRIKELAWGQGRRGCV